MLLTYYILLLDADLIRYGRLTITTETSTNTYLWITINQPDTISNPKPNPNPITKRYLTWSPFPEVAIPSFYPRAATARVRVIFSVCRP